MADEDSGQSQADTTANDTGKSDAGAGDEEPFDKSRAMSTIAKLRDEVKAGKGTAKELAEARARLKELEDAKLSDSEKQANRIRELEAENARLQGVTKATTIERAVRSEATKAGAIEPDAIADLLRGSNEAEFDKDGNVTNAKALVDAAKARYPRMFGARVGSADGGAGGRTNGTVAGADWVRAGIR